MQVWKTAVTKLPKGLNNRCGKQLFHGTGFIRAAYDFDQRCIDAKPHKVVSDEVACKVLCEWILGYTSRSTFSAFLMNRY